MNKQNKIIMLMLIAVFSVALNQDASAQIGRAGIKGGLNASNLYIDDVTDNNPRFGYHVGLYGQIFSSSVFAIQPELLFSTKGSTTQYGGTNNQEVSYNLNYIDLPVLAVIKLGSVGEVHLGGYASYLVGANISYKNDVGSGATKINKDNLKSYDYGLAAGMGLNFGKVQIGARYNYGFVQLANSDAAKVLIGDAKNSCLQLYASLNLRTK